MLELAAEVSCVTHGVRIGFSSPTTLSDQVDLCVIRIRFDYHYLSVFEIPVFRLLGPQIYVMIIAVL